METPTKRKPGFAGMTPEQRTETGKRGVQKAKDLGTLHFMRHPMSHRKAQFYGRYGGMLSHGGGRPRKGANRETV